MMDIHPRDRRATPNRKWCAFVAWNGAWKRVPIELEKARQARPTL